MNESNERLIKTPWDTRALGFDTYELKSVSNETFKQINGLTGHFTIKVDPLMKTKVLHDAGFYYCDTLIEPYAIPAQFKNYPDDHIVIRSEIDRLEELVKMTEQAFVYGRFHRDFSIDSHIADERYINWLRQLNASGTLFALYYGPSLAGFFGYCENKIVLHALSPEYRGKGLAKYFWSRAIQDLFNMGHTEIVSSVSAANLAVVNLYASLGFRFRHAVDVYHKMNF